MRLISTPSSLGALLLVVKGGGSKSVKLTAGGPRSAVAQLSGTDAYRALLQGPLGAGEIARVLISDASHGSPSVSVIDAAAGASGGYAIFSPGAIGIALVRSGTR
ncbi:MAG: hypothetical protein Q8K82_09670 [Gemmatimonadaceae bacterium]|nr:hypothetical protein [Gemmatimonadaceae bacterium]